MIKHAHPWTVILVFLILLVECLCIPPVVVDAIKHTNPVRQSHGASQRDRIVGFGRGHGQGYRNNHQTNSFRGQRSRGMIVTYWGQFDNEPSLQDACQSKNYNIIILSFLDNFGHYKKPRLDLAGHCDPGSGECRHLSKEIETCQRMGVKILLSIGGADGGYGLESAKDAKATALHIWNSYLGGRSDSDDRPLGPAVLDGVDFDVEKGNEKQYATLAIALKSFMLKFRSKHGKDFILAAAPQCPFEDEFMGPGKGTALGTGVFDYVWVQFYNNEQCHYNPKGRDPSRVLKSWKRWTSALPRSKIFLGLPASLDASTDRVDMNAGFMPIDVLVHSVLPVIKKSPNYGGVMLWSYYYDSKSNHGKDRVFSRAIEGSL